MSAEGILYISLGSHGEILTAMKSLTKTREISCIFPYCLLNLNVKFLMAISFYFVLNVYKITLSSVVSNTVWKKYIWKYTQGFS